MAILDVSSHEPLHITVAVRSDPGKQRTGPNQDSYLVALADGAPREGWAALAVCDGMGGAAGGEVASSTAVATLRDVMGASEHHDVARALVTAVEEASRRIYAAQQRDRTLAGMGTTTTACALAARTLFVAQVGDSRAYLLRGGELTRITRDQTLAQQLVELGQLAPEEVESFEHSNIILQAVGTHERVDVDLRSVDLAAGDVLLVCSDGLHGVAGDAAIRGVLLGESTPEDACDALIDLAYSKGAPDNVTCLVARIDAIGDRDGEPMGEPGPVEVVKASLAPLPSEEEELADAETMVSEPATNVVEGGEGAPPPGLLQRFMAFFGA